MVAIVSLRVLFKYVSIVTNHSVDPAFRLMRLPLDGELDFYLKEMIC